jgi:hypothetical protein
MPMSLFPNEDVVTRETESWGYIAEYLSSEEYKELLNKMLNDYYKYATATNTKGEPFPTETLIMALGTEVVMCLVVVDNFVGICLDCRPCSCHNSISSNITTLQ